MPLQATSGAASYDAFGGGVAAVPKYIEEYFSTFLYTGTGAAQTITNGIDLATKGGLVWYKSRSNVTDHGLVDTARGMTAGSSPILASNLTDSQIAINNYVIANTTGFSFGSNATGTNANASGYTYTSWTWAKAPKFFDVVTYTGTGTSGRAIPHSLGSTPGCIIVKCTTNTYDWMVYHRSLPSSSYFLKLNTTAAQVNVSSIWSTTAPTATNFYVGSDGSTNGSGETYVAYLFAHDAGGFGLTGTDNVISCGSFTDTTTVNLGYEPQWVLFKKSSSSSIGDWFIADNMRGFSETSINTLSANTSSAEASYSNTGCVLTSTGFTYNTGLAGSGTFIYIAIRRGPMKVPTSGTTVYNAVARTGTGASANITGVGFPTDLVLSLTRNFGGTDHLMVDRLRGSSAQIFTNLSAAESTNATSVTSLASNDGISVGTDYPIQSINYASGYTYVTNFFKRAPSFFDEVCYTGTGVAGRTVTHNLTVAPELMIVKGRSNAGQWRVYSSALGATQAARLNSTDSFGSNPFAWNNTAPTASVFTVGDDTGVNENTYTYVAYLFATCAGVSKCGTFTGNGSTQTIDCGFGAGGARFVLIKRTDATGDWYVYDTARGMTTLTDPYLLMNSTAAETATLGSVTTVSTGFALNSAILAAINVSSGSYIFLAIA